MKSGILNVYKEAGYTSFDVVAKLRRILGIKKIGHTGTLDPDAVGVLPVCIGRATRLCDMLTDSDKTYEAELVLGIKTDTGDLSGNVIASSSVDASEDDVTDVIMSFVGEIAQIPPMYSALKVNGQKLVDLARKGVTVDRKPRNVTIYSIEIISMSLPKVDIRVSCSKGTYIRTLCEDIGEMLGCYGTMGKLKRTVAAGFSVVEAHTLDEIEKIVEGGAIDNYITGIDKVLSHPRIDVAEEFDNYLKNGVTLYPEELSMTFELDQRYLVYDFRGDFVGVYIGTDEGLKVVKMFYENGN